MISKAHQRIIREKMEKEESYNLFGKWWDDINKSKNSAVKIAKIIIQRYCVY